MRVETSNPSSRGDKHLDTGNLGNKTPWKKAPEKNPGKKALGKKSPGK